MVYQASSNILYYVFISSTLFVGQWFSTTRWTRPSEYRESMILFFADDDQCCVSSVTHYENDWRNLRKQTQLTVYKEKKIKVELNDGYFSIYWKSLYSTIWRELLVICFSRSFTDQSSIFFCTQFIIISSIFILPFIVVTRQKPSDWAGKTTRSCSNRIGRLFIHRQRTTMDDYIRKC